MDQIHIMYLVKVAIYYFLTLFLLKYLKGVMKIKLTMEQRRQWNDELRRKLDNVVHQNGLKFSFIAEKLDMSLSTFSHWKQSRYNFKPDKLEMVEDFIRPYIKN